MQDEARAPLRNLALPAVDGQLIPVRECHGLARERSAFIGKSVCGRLIVCL